MEPIVYILPFIKSADNAAIFIGRDSEKRRTFTVIPAQAGMTDADVP